MDQDAVVLTMVGMMAVTYAPRVFPLWLLATRPVPGAVGAWLRYVPAAVLAAMVAPLLFVADGRIDVGLGNLYLWAAVPTVLVAARTRSFYGSVVAGVATVAVARLLGA